MSDAVDRAAAEIRSRRFVCEPCRKEFKNAAGLKSHLKMVRHPVGSAAISEEQTPNPVSSVSPPPAPSTVPAAPSSPAAPPAIAAPANVAPTEKMIGYVFGLVFMGLAVLLKARSITLSDEEEAMLGEIWQPVAEEYKDEPTAQWIFRYLPILAAIGASCTVVRDKYDGYQEEKKKRVIEVKPTSSVPAPPVEP